LPDYTLMQTRREMISAYAVRIPRLGLTRMEKASQRDASYHACRELQLGFRVERDSFLLTPASETVVAASNKGRNEIANWSGPQPGRSLELRWCCN